MLTLYFLQSMENTLEVIEHLTNNVKEKLSEKQAYSSQLNRETEEQKPKLERVTKQVLLFLKTDLSYLYILEFQMVTPNPPSIKKY